MERYKHFANAVEAFKKAEVIAVAGYSSDPKQPANAIYARLDDNGYTVYAVNPNPEKLDVPGFPSLQALPSKPDAVVIATPPKATEEVMDDCIAEGISLVWIHRAVDNGSFNQAAYDKGVAAGISVIPAGCPMMFVEADFFHSCLRWFMKTGGKLKMEKTQGVLPTP